MDQEQMLDRGVRVALETGKQLFHFLAYTLDQLAKENKEIVPTGEQSLKEFNKSTLTKDKIDFQESEVNFKKFKEELEKSGVRFSVEKNKDGTRTVWFEAPNQKVIAHALKKTLDEIVTDPKAAKEKYMKTDKELLPKEQIEKIKAEKAKEKGAKEAVKNKKKGKSL
ncbi:DUF3801 domain-containing protein [Streptococcus alactolyticus]|uniref:DUF3801 domain-containing protein n=1 Tax=Streptococcus alactolyticus TaxID=29389 RepID=UPI00374FFE31